MKAKNLFNLEGKVALVTGGAQGLGRAMALGLTSYGCDVIVVDINLEKAKETVNEIRNLGNKSKAYMLDVSKVNKIEEIVDKAINDFDKIDILVNSAGTVIRKPAIEMTENDWDTILNINLKGTYFFCKNVGEHMIKHEKGKIINIASVSSKLGHPERSVYAASKGGVAQITKSLANEWAKYNINVNAISPTVFETPLTVNLRNTEEKLQKTIKRIPLGRLGKPEDLVGAVVFLSSPASDFITGHNLFVDGGRTVD